MTIPASYLFRDIYKQQWEEPEAPRVIQSTKPFGGTMRPVVRAMFAWFERKTHHHVGGHAYE